MLSVIEQHNQSAVCSHFPFVLKASNGLTEKITDESNSHYINKYICSYVGNA